MHAPCNVYVVLRCWLYVKRYKASVPLLGISKNFHITINHVHRKRIAYRDSQSYDAP